MRGVAVFSILGWLLSASAIAMFVPAAFAVALDPVAVAQAFLVPIIVIGFLGGTLILAFRGREMLTSRRDNLVLLGMIWIVTPVAGALPLYMTGYPDRAMAAVFEAVSGFTTTGATVFLDLESVPASVIVWRALLQWIGGLTTLLAIAAVLGPLAGTDLFDRQLRLIGRSTHGSVHHLVESVRTILPLYLALTTGCFVALVLSQVPAFDAFCLALTTVSTGGFMPRGGAIADYGSPAAELMLTVFMVLGAVSIVWIAALFQGRWPVVRETHEPFWFMWLVLASGVLAGILLLAQREEASALAFARDLAAGLATAASWITTTGFPVSAHETTVIPYMIVLTVCIIGGGRFSTAGGLKLYRVVAMLRQLGRELALLVYPHGVRPARSGEEERDAEVMKMVWTAFAALIAAISILAVILSAQGVPFSDALLAAVGALSNVGPVYEVWRGGELAAGPGYGEMGTTAQLALSVGMILGRVEIVAMAGLLSLLYWRQ